jgi:NAD(P)H-dependent FMN reductase
MNKVTVIVGSHRNDSQSGKVGRVIANKLEAMDGVDSVSTLDLATADLPFWQESYTDEEQARIKQTREQLRESDAFVVIAPEWNGMVPSALKNLFLLYSAGEFAHKPALIASVSAGIGGTYPVTELRSTTYKNSRICYIPEHLIFRDVESIFNEDSDNSNDAHRYMSERTDYALDYLVLYSNSLKQVREQQPVNKEFGNGM